MLNVTNNMSEYITLKKCNINLLSINAKNNSMKLFYTNYFF